MLITHTIHNPNTDEETEVVLPIKHYPFRRGDGPGARHGMTPNEPEEVILEEIFVEDGVSLASDHPFFGMVSEEELLTLVQDKNEERPLDLE